MSVDNELVVLLHGMARTNRSMAGLARYLETQGFRTLNITYPSRYKNLDALTDYVHEAIGTQAASAGQVHFVTHSMGGLVARRLFSKYRPPNLGRTVMLGTPHRGSEVADWLRRYRLYWHVYGPAGLELTTDHQGNAVPEQDIDFDLGVIAGTVGWPYLLGTLLLKKPHDGRVSVESTRLRGMKDHIAMPIAHSFMMNNPAVRRQVASFLKTGCFEPSADAPAPTIQS